MYKEELVDKMKGIKALLYMASTTTRPAADRMAMPERSDVSLIDSNCSNAIKIGRNCIKFVLHFVLHVLF